MKKELLSEIKRMKELAGINENFTRAELMQQDDGDNLDSLIDKDLELGDNIQSASNMYGTQDKNIDSEEAEESDNFNAQQYSQDLHPQPTTVDTTNTTPEEISDNAEKNLYPGPYKSVYSGEQMMESEKISDFDDDEELMISF